MLTQEYLKERLDYDPKTGDFTWKYNPSSTKTWNTRFAGQLAGSFRYDDRPRHTYWSINIGGKHCTGHRLAWLYVYGYLPEMIDHRDGDGLNNRISNLRECTKAQNAANTYNPNVGIRRTVHGYQARIQVNNSSICLGTFTTEEKAREAYRSYCTQATGEFSRFNREEVA